MNFFLLEKLLQNYIDEFPPVPSLDLSLLTRDSFEISENLGNNSFAYYPGKRIFSSPVGEYAQNVLKQGTLPALAEEIDGKVVEYNGLNFQLYGHTPQKNLPFFICDNHNLVLEAWNLVKENQYKLIHIDQHRDNAKFIGNPENWLKETVICNYIDFALKSGWITENYESFTESSDLERLYDIETDSPVILNIDLDFFAPEVTILTLEEKIELICHFLPQTRLLTLSTSPGFIDQDLAIKIAETLISHL